MYKFFFKQLFDFVFAIIALLILLPLFIVVGIVIKIDSSGPIFFRQERLGQNGKIFKIFKFRSMRTDMNIKVAGVFEDDPRITNVGKFIRKTSIDELPQVINIILGEMSFIGPRPPLPYHPKQFSDYNSFEKKRFEVKPGISGLAQIRCREVHDWNVNIPIDIEYVENFSFVNDLKLFFASFAVFLKSDNIYSKK